MTSLISNMIEAGRFNAGTYERVEADPHSTAGAVLFVILSSVAAAVGGGLYGAWAIASLTVATTLSWLAWVGLTYFIGKRLMAAPETNVTFMQILRTTGFSASPGLLRVFGGLPVVGWPIFMAANVWMLLTFVIAIRHALDFKSTLRAVAVSFLGWLVYSFALFALVGRVL